MCRIVDFAAIPRPVLEQHRYLVRYWSIRIGLASELFNPEPQATAFSPNDF